MFKLLNYNKETNAKVEFIAKIFTGVQTTLAASAFASAHPIIGWICIGLALFSYIAPIFVGPENPFLKNRPNEKQDNDSSSIHSSTNTELPITEELQTGSL